MKKEADIDKLLLDYEVEKDLNAKSWAKLKPNVNPRTYSERYAGLFFMSVDDAAFLSAVCMLREESLSWKGNDFDKKVPTVKFLHSFLSKEINEYRSGMIKAIEAKTLNANKELDMDGNIKSNRTFVEIDDVIDFFNERGLQIVGAEYHAFIELRNYYFARIFTFSRKGFPIDEINKVLELNDFIEEQQQYVEFLEKTLDDVLKKVEAESLSDNSIGTREKDTLLRIIIGLAMKGYGYDPSQARSTAIPEMLSDMQLLGIQVSDDTLRNKLREAKERLEPPV